MTHQNLDSIYIESVPDKRSNLVHNHAVVIVIVTEVSY